MWHNSRRFLGALTLFSLIVKCPCSVVMASPILSVNNNIDQFRYCVRNFIELNFLTAHQDVRGNEKKCLQRIKLKCEYHWI